MKLVTIAQFAAHARIDQIVDVDDVELKIQAASEAVMAYLGEGAAGFTDTNGDIFTDSQGDPLGVPARVQQATLLTAAAMYRERDGSQEYAVPSAFGYGYQLPQGATALLFGLRKHTVL